MKNFEEFLKKYRVLYALTMFCVGLGLILNGFLESIPRWIVLTLLVGGFVGFGVMVFLYVRNLIRVKKN